MIGWRDGIIRCYSAGKQLRRWQRATSYCNLRWEQMIPEQVIDRGACRELLQIARVGLRTFVLDHLYYLPPLDALPPFLAQPASSFVTLYHNASLRGCIGTTHATYPLAVDVARNAAAASRDPRFPPVQVQEVDVIRLEVSVLQPCRPLIYEDYKDLLQKLRPGVDGVIISWQKRRALLLPQVWERLPEPAEFLQALCYKARIPRRTLQAAPPEIAVLTFEASLFKEDDDSETH